MLLIRIQKMLLILFAANQWHVLILLDLLLITRPRLPLFSAELLRPIQ